MAKSEAPKTKEKVRRPTNDTTIRALQSVMRVMVRERRGIPSPADLDVLHGVECGESVEQMAARRNVSEQAIYQSLRRLEDEGLLRRRRDGAPGYIVGLSPTGATVLAASRAWQGKAALAARERLSAKERLALAEVLRLVLG